MAKSLFAQPPKTKLGNDRPEWRRDLHNAIFGEENSGGSLNDDNMEEALLTVTAVKAALLIAEIEDADGTLPDITTKFNNLLQALKDIGIMEGG